MSDVLPIAGAVLILFLALQAPSYYLGALIFLFRKRTPRDFPDSADSVVILIPARNEGRGALLAIQSLASQNYEGMLEIALLVRDASDSSVPFLNAAYPNAQSKTGTELELLNSRNRRVTIHFTGSDAKHAKINWMLSRIAAPYTAILDADHQAHEDWIRTSVALLKENNARIIQSRREPVSAHGLFGLWDSLHQHVGCEVFNETFRALNLTTFFTGSTAVFETALLRDSPLEDCLTEDTNLSYSRILAGEKILYNPYSGSKEEVSPDLYSFLARRRRWAHGHTEAFLRHLRGSWKTQLGFSGRVQFLFHGMHYLVSLAVFAAHAMIGFILAPRFELSSLIAAACAGFFVSLSLVRGQRVQKGISAVLALVVLFFWFAPAALFGLGLAHAILTGDFSIIALPVPPFLQVIGLICLAAPPFMLLTGLAGFRQLGPGIMVAVLLTYPVGLYLYVAGALIGLIELRSGNRIWHVIGRSDRQLPHSGIRESWRTKHLFRKFSNLIFSGKSIMKPTQWILAVVLLLLLAGGVYFGQAGRVPVASRACQALEHDKDPWIVQPQKMNDYCDENPRKTSGKRTGSFSLQRRDDLHTIDESYWDRLNTTFFCNNAVFSPPNVKTNEKGMELWLKPERAGGKEFTAASIATKDLPEARYRYGRFEVEMKPPRISGVLTAFFLYRFDPWQEIDMEFPGKDTSKILLNVYYNPGVEGDLYNYGYRGTPVLVDLGFDASSDFHRYAIEWDPLEIRWFVDDALIHARPAGKPTPVPHLPMRFHISSWPICSEEVAGKLEYSRLPVATSVRSIQISTYNPPIMDRFFKSATDDHWRERAKWMQPDK